MERSYERFEFLLFGMVIRIAKRFRAQVNLGERIMIWIYDLDLDNVEQCFHAETFHFIDNYFSFFWHILTSKANYGKGFRYRKMIQDTAHSNYAASFRIEGCMSLIAFTPRAATSPCLYYV
ncbi:unnamed protein product [Cylicostephanus goldi]|uniref:Uncharacterized protein n=1 Tax=Cylicostephanus goldi TaxID=71465 RepID=A0A3P7MS56_CYLGO|nr:unnamed protein product [Cylicostephanus goldi]